MIPGTEGEDGMAVRAQETYTRNVTVNEVHYLFNGMSALGEAFVSAITNQLN